MAGALRTVGALAAVGLLVSACGQAGQRPATAMRATLSTSFCAAADLGLSLGPLVSPRTGEHADLLVVRNRSQRRCALGGYPLLTLSHHGRSLPFVDQNGGGPYLPANTQAPTITLRPGARAYVLIAKYRCDGPEGVAADRITLTIPGSPGRLSTRLTRSGVGQFDYCPRYPGDAPIDPGDRVAASPLEPSLAAIYRPTRPALRGNRGPSSGVS